MNRVAIHCMTADDDIITDLGWGGVELYVVIDHETDDVLYASLNSVTCLNWAIDNGYDPINSSDMFTVDNGRWVQR